MHRLESRIRKIESRADNDTQLTIAGFTLAGCQLSDILKRIDGKSRGLPNERTIEAAAG